MGALCFYLQLEINTNSMRSIMIRIATLALLASVLIINVVDAATYKPILPHQEYKHDRWGTQVLGAAGEKNYRREFRAYISVFDGEDDDNGDGIIDILGVPHFVAYELKKYDGDLPKGPKRPSSWMTDKKLWKLGIAPKDATYRHSKAFLSNNPNWYVRGHLCMKYHAWRLGNNADWNTHTTLNAVPQRQDFNAGIWLDLENKTADWADKYGAVWIIAGPIFEPQTHTPRAWLGEVEKGEITIGIPDKLFKIVIRETQDPSKPEVLAFEYPQDITRGAPYDHTRYLRSVDYIENKTGIDFLSSLPDDVEKLLESVTPENIWAN